MEQAILEVGIPLNAPVEQVPPPVIEEHGGLPAIDRVINADCEICMMGQIRNHVVLPCGHLFCTQCALNIVIWHGTNEDCPMESKCFMCRTRVASVHRVFL